MSHADDGAFFAVDVTTSFESFYAEHQTHITKALALALNHGDLGRDAAAEGLARAWQRWDQVGQYDNPAGWVFRVGLNWGRSRLRRRRREVTSALLPEESTPPPASDDGLARALAGLSDEHRAVVVARYYLDWSEADTAAALGIAPGTAKSRLHRALAQLAQDERIER